MSKSKMDSGFGGHEFVTGQGWERLACHAYLVSASHLSFGFDLAFEI
jgi:hypothetical protein